MPTLDLGWPRLRPLLVAAHDRTASVSARRLLGLLRRAGLTGWVTNLRVGRWEVDVAFPAARVAIELDSWAWHVDPDRYQGDRRKQNALVTAGWTVLRFTWQDVTARPDHVLQVLGQALARSA